MRIVAVVVTYNRKELLLECLSAIRSQDLDPDCSLDTIVIDNASTDGTRDALQLLVSTIYSAERQLLYYNTGANLGGAGGFQYGIRRAVELGYDYLWIMDDDCIPEDTALSQLISFYLSHKSTGYLSSKALWKDGTICRMNIQRQELTKNVKDYSQKSIPIVMASFVSLFVPAVVVLDVGLPIKEFFIWTDDWEFTRRISRKYPAYLVTDSVVVHKSASNIFADVSNETVDRLDRFNYLYRNDVFLYRREGIKGFLYECVRLACHCIRVIVHSKDHKVDRLKKIIHGTIAGFSFHPRIEYIGESRSENT